MVGKVFSDRGRGVSSAWGRLAPRPWRDLVALVIALALMILSLTGCQTVQGLGRDITAAGEACERALEKP